MTQEVLKLALEALEAADWYINQLEMIVYSLDDDGTHENRAKVQAAITAIKEALARPQQEPVAFCDPSDPDPSTAFSWPGTARKRGHTTSLHTTPPQRNPLTDEEELSNGFAMALHDAMLIRIGADDEATQQATARIDKLVNKYKIKIAHDIKE